MKDLDWLSKKPSEYLIIHRHELKEEVRLMEVRKIRKQDKIDTIDDILEERKNKLERVYGG